MLPFELPRLFLRILCQRPLRFAKGLGEWLAPFALAATGLHHSGIRHGIDRPHHARIGPSGRAGPVLSAVKTFCFWPAFRVGPIPPVHFACAAILIGMLFAWGSNLQVLHGLLIARRHCREAQVLVHLQALLAGVPADELNLGVG